MMSDIRSVIVVGAGLAAGTAVAAMRDAGYDGGLVVLGEEPHRPYERPPLSKDLLLGTSRADDALVHPAGWYDEHDVDLRLGVRAVGLDRGSGEVVVSTGERLGYDRVLLATGSAPRRLRVADDSGAPIAYLRTFEDSLRIRAALRPGARVVVIGGGWIGLEVAAAARAAGSEVTVVESLEAPLLRVLGPEVAATFAGLHREHGVDLRTGAGVERIDSAGATGVVHLTDGSSLTADLVVVGIGVVPVTALAEEAGLGVDDGVVVDEHLRTTDPAVYAAGDVASAWHPGLGRRLRVEHWDTAIGQGGTAGRGVVGGDEVYDRMPYFFSDQYDLGLEYVGSVGPDGYDDVVLRGDVDGRVFTAFWIAGGRVVAGMHVNDWDAIDPVRAIVDAGGVDLARLRDASVPLTDVAEVGEGG